MPRVAIRLLLALCLVLNGIGNAMAAAAVPAMPDAAQDAVIPMTDAAASASTCAHAADARVPAAEAPVPAAPFATHCADCDQDYCAEGACHCPCMQLVLVALLDRPSLPAVSDRTHLVPALALGHPAPVPLDVIRPPIG